jgi:hypothetical protein
MPSKPLDRFLPANLAQEFNCAWYELTAVQLVPHVAASPWERRQLEAVAAWASMWRQFEAAIAERLSSGDTLAAIARSGGLTSKALTQIRGGWTWPDSLTALRLARALDIEIVVEAAR